MSLCRHKNVLLLIFLLAYWQIPAACKAYQIADQSRDLRNYFQDVFARFPERRQLTLPFKRYQYEISVINAQGKTIHLNRVDISILGQKTWRKDERPQLSGPEHIVSARSGELFFVANKARGGEYFRELGIGYEPDFGKAQLDTFVESNKLIFFPRSMAFEWIDDWPKSAEVLSVEEVTTTGGDKGERVVWKDEKIYENSDNSWKGKTQHGELVWLPNSGYVVESFNIWVGEKTQANPPKFTGKLTYQLIGDKNVLTSCELTASRQITRLKLIDVSLPVSDRAYYLPESIGLKSPVNPNWIKLLWLVCGVLFLAAGFHFFRSFRNG